MGLLERGTAPPPPAMGPIERGQPPPSLGLRFYSVESPPAISHSLPARLVMQLVYAIFHLDLLFGGAFAGLHLYGVVEADYST